jgi:putative SbcD/Mre11-related phosphoesterase
MEIDLQPISDSPALKMEHDRGTAVVVADLHLGVEHAISDAGVLIPKRTWHIQKQLIELCKAAGSDKLIILGDIKHTVPSTSWQEAQELPEFFRGLKREIKHIEIIPGNHDTNLKNLLPEDIVFHEASGLNYHGVGLAHGHKWPSEDVVNSSILVLAHNHPTIVLIDELDVHHSYPCWVRGPVNKNKLMEKYGEEAISHLKEVIIVPSFLEFGSGTVINGRDQDMLGPFLRNGLMDLPKSKVHLLDGTYLGILEKLYLNK